jgi:competence protein ComEC
VDGTGYVRSAELLEDAPLPAGSFGDWLRGRGGAHTGLVLALTEGDRSGVSEALWNVLRTTGTVHLLVVSGLHVGLVCGTTFVLCAWGLRFAALFSRLPTEPAAALLALAVGGWYVVSSGSGVPALRAWLMATAFLLLRVSGWRCGAGSVLLVALAVLLVMDPLMVHQSGAYLSFAAVAVLLVHSGALATNRGAIAGLVRAQLALFLGLCPVLAAQQGVVPGAGVLANLVAVPLLMLLLPMLLVAMGCWQLAPAVASLLVSGGELILGVLLGALDVAAASPTLPAAGTLSPAIALALAAGLLLLAGCRWRLGMMLAPAWLSWLAPVGSDVPVGGFRVTALDVGQGSAVLVDTRTHRLLFDAGPAYPGGFDLGAAAVVPGIRASGPAKLDALVLSHADNDHSGGARSVLEGLSVAGVYSSFLPRDPVLGPAWLAGGRCADGTSWQWDGVDFRFLHPDRASDGPSAVDENDRSCVLRVSNGRRTLLLAGDIGRRVERRLARRLEGLLAADVMTAPHHGSNTSSSPSWLAATRPGIVFVSAPRRSRYGHPHPAVVARYESIAARVLVTGRDGALIWESWRPERVRSLRRESAYWANREQVPDARARPGG